MKNRQERYGQASSDVEGILLIDKPKGITSFGIVSRLRRLLNVKKIGHSGTLDPFATGVMVMLIGKPYTRLSEQMIKHDKEYIAEVKLGVSTDTFDCEGAITFTSDKIPAPEEMEACLDNFQGEVEQVPPMFSAKKVNGKKLYELARKGHEVERKPAKVFMETTLISYNYPFLNIHVKCSKGTYIRSIADDLGKLLDTGAHLTNLKRVRSGPYSIEECLCGESLKEGILDFEVVYRHLKKT